MRAEICMNCYNLSACREQRIYCEALNKLYEVYDDSKKEVARELITELRPLLSMEDAEECSEYKELADKVIQAIPELQFIHEMDIKVGYVKSFEPKQKNGKLIMGQCEKLKDIYQAFIPFDFIITFYEPNIEELNDNQIKALMWHELCHIGLNERTLKTTYTVNPHDIEDFYSITDRLGTKWAREDIGDILGGIE